MKAQIVITLNDDGSVSLSGPVEDQVLFFGLMAVAENVANNLAQQKMKLKEGGPNLVTPVNGMPVRLPPELRPGPRGIG